MGKRFIGAILATTAIVCAASQVSFARRQTLPVEQRATLVAAQAAPQRGGPPPVQAPQPSRISGRPNFNGIWQAINSAYWNLEAHSLEALPAFWQLGAIAAIPAGRSVVKGGGAIPYLPEALKKRDENRSKWPASDPEAKCYMLGIPRATYHNIPFQIFQGDGDILMVYPFAAANRVIAMKDHTEPPVDSWMGKSTGKWDGDVLVVTTTGQNEQTWLDRAGNHHSNKLKVTERFRLIDSGHIQYEATLEDPLTYSKPWTIEMPLYRLIDDNAQLMEHKCVPFADNLLYEDLLKPKK